jgi:hypothetical protein
MTKITIKMVLMLSVVAVLVVGICGCTSVSNPLATSSDNRAVDYGNAFVKLLKAEPGNQTVTDSKVVANGSDAAQLTVVMENRTVNKTSILWQNGTRTTMSFNIKSCGSTDAATTFFNDQSFGMTPPNSSEVANMTLPTNDAYKAAFGTAATTNNEAAQFGTFNFIELSMSMVMQQNDIVMYGTLQMVGL